jgi:hypothetical protein
VNSFKSTTNLPGSGGDYNLASLPREVSSGVNAANIFDTTHSDTDKEGGIQGPVEPVKTKDSPRPLGSVASSSEASLVESESVKGCCAE